MPRHRRLIQSLWQPHDEVVFLFHFVKEGTKAQSVSRGLPFTLGQVSLSFLKWHLNTALLAFLPWLLK